MHGINFNSLDLNLLRVLDVLIEERSVMRAGERLGLTQSAVSHALNRLRYALKDDLLVRGPDGMQPTARAVQIGPRLRQGLIQLELGLNATEFVPAEADRQFTIACNDHACAAIVPGLMARLRQEAPSASLRVVPSHRGVAEGLLAGRVDLAIGGFGRIPDRFASETLYQETMVWVLSANNPASREALTLERLAQLPHLIIALTGEDERAVDGVVPDHGLEWRVMRDDAGAFQDALAARGLRRHVGLTVPHVLTAPRSSPARTWRLDSAAAGDRLCRALSPRAVRATLPFAALSRDGAVGARLRAAAGGALAAGVAAAGGQQRNCWP